MTMFTYMFTSQAVILSLLAFYIMLISYGIYKSFPIVKNVLNVISYNKYYIREKHARNRYLVKIDGQQNLNIVQARDAISDLVDYARRLDPDWIFGVHLAGRLLSSYVANRIQLPKHRLGYIRSGRGKVDSISLISNSNDTPSGVALVIDDIFRTGQTLAAVKSQINIDNYHGKTAFSRTRFCTLVRVVRQPQEMEFESDWSHFETENIELSLPWSDFVSAVRNNLESRADGETYDGDIIRSYNDILENSEMAVNKLENILYQSEEV
ncbi:MAG: phosphoribosyltransferase [Sphingomonadales bacterium]|nr:phosphoribosyltransferase [Sphingomonadales bacterium]